MDNPTQVRNAELKASLMIVPKDTPENFASYLRTWADCIIREDGDRDEDSGSRLTCEQALAVARIMLGAAYAIDALLNERSKNAYHAD